MHCPLYCIAGLMLIWSAGCEPPTVADDPQTDVREDQVPAAHPQAAETSAREVTSDEATKRKTPQHGVDWPRFLGPGRDSKSPETGILTEWPKSGPPLIWQREIGTGYSIGVVSRGRFFQFDRYGDLATLLCLDSKTGKEQWRFAYETDFRDQLGYNNGPRCSPIVDDDRVYIMGAEGMLHCVRFDDGKLVWKRNTSEEYGVVQNFFGVGSTPIIDGDLLIANIGGSPPGSPELYESGGAVKGNGTGVVAFDKFTGEEKYRLTDELASYASPVIAKLHDRRFGLVFARGGLVAFEPMTGKLDFHFPWRAKLLESVNASTPIVFDNQVFITETYGPGAALLEVTKDGKHRVVWDDERRRRDKAMQCHWNTPIYHEGYIYGSSGRHAGNAELRCIGASDGKVMWSEPGLTRSSLLYADGHFVCLSENGVLRLLKATPEKFDMVAAAMILDDAPPDDPRSADERNLLKYPCWAAPVLSHGLLYLRGDTHLVCLELIPPGAEK